jgi:hypothetical protein
MKKALGKSNLAIVRDYLNGERPFIQVGYTADSDFSSRKDGEIWIDANGKKWIKKNGTKRAINNVSSSTIESTKRHCKDCNMDIRWGNRYDEVLYNKTGRCQECLAKFETQLRLNGKYDDYEQKKLLQNQLSQAKEFRIKVQESYDFVSTHEKISFPNGDGTLDEWTIERRENILKDLKTDLKKIDKQIVKIEGKLEKLNHVE